MCIINRGFAFFYMGNLRKISLSDAHSKIVIPLSKRLIESLKNKDKNNKDFKCNM